jgi:ubiquinone/menaquinone biosynthesis C-methylase UbiE
MTSIDYGAITARQQAVWATGDFHELARQILPVSESLVAACDPRAGERVLDVACGSGNAALVAARRYCDVSGVDFVPALLDRARQRAAAEGTPVDFQVGDAQALPYPDAHFDVVLSVFGVMFAPDQERAANELLRVCRPAGRIGLCCWIPEASAADSFASSRSTCRRRQDSIRRSGGGPRLASASSSAPGPRRSPRRSG